MQNIADVIDRGQLRYVSAQGYKGVAAYLDDQPFFYDYSQRVLHPLTPDGPMLVPEADVEPQARSVVLDGMREALAAGRVY